MSSRGIRGHNREYLFDRIRFIDHKAVMTTTFASCVMLLGNVTRWRVPLPRIGLLATAWVTCTNRVPQSCTRCRSILCNHVTSTVSYCKIPGRFRILIYPRNRLAFHLFVFSAPLFISWRAVEFCALITSVC